MLKLLPFRGNRVSSARLLNRLSFYGSLPNSPKSEECWTNNRFGKFGWQGAWVESWNLARCNYFIALSEYLETTGISSSMNNWSTEKSMNNRRNQSCRSRSFVNTYRTAFSPPDSPDGFDREWNPWTEPMVFAGTVSLLAWWRNWDIAKHMSCCDRRHKCHGIRLYPMENMCLDN